MIITETSEKLIVKCKNLWYIVKRATVLQGGLTFHSNRMEVMPMKNHFDFKDLLTFGIFLLALLTFIFNFCK